MKNYWKNTRFTKLVRIKSEHLSFLKKAKGKRSIAETLEQIIDEHRINFIMKTPTGKLKNKTILLEIYGPKKLQNSPKIKNNQ